MSQPDLFSLVGRTALVTGANTGIGQGIALALASAGADIVAVGRSAPDETAEKVRAAGRRFHSIEADLGSASHSGEIIQQAVEHFGAVDILVNNAGIIRRNDALEFSESDWDAVMNVNLKTAFFLSQAAARHMLKLGRGGKIINIASMLSFQGGVRVVSYTASKSGIAGMTRILANEWAAKGINVNAIAPGYISTNNTTALRSDETRNREILGRIPAGRWGKPEDLGGAAIFLASRASDYMHGAIIPVDGGWLAR
jgi:2-deoxy-D-gluconate 3-dehydrogenase